MKDIPRWMMADPSRVYERIEAMQQAQAARAPKAKQERARKESDELFKEDQGEQE